MNNNKDNNGISHSTSCPSNGRVNEQWGKLDEFFPKMILLLEDSYAWGDNDVTDHIPNLIIEWEIEKKCYWQH